jgi:hypothetical protein
MNKILTIAIALIVNSCVVEIPDLLKTKNCTNPTISYTVDNTNKKKLTFIISQSSEIDYPISWQTNNGLDLGKSLVPSLDYTFTDGTYSLQAKYKNACGDNVSLTTNTFTIAKTCTLPTSILLISNTSGKYIFKLDGTVSDVASVTWTTTKASGAVVNQITNTNTANFETTLMATDTYNTSAQITTTCGEKITRNYGFNYTAPAGSIKDVYICGYEGKRAVYWKNGIPVYLTDGTYQAQANSIKVIGNNVFVVGFENDGKYNFAKYWINGISTNLTGLSFNSFGYSLDYAFFYYKKNESVEVYSITKINGDNNDPLFNGKILNLSLDFEAGTNPTKMIINKNTPYYISNGGLGGFYFTSGLDGRSNLIYGNSKAVYRDIDFNNNDLYITGNLNNIASYWKNGNLVSLSTSISQAFAMAINGNDIYVAGVIGANAVYWKNGILNTLPTTTDQLGNYVPNSISGIGSDIYVVGKNVRGGSNIDSYAVYWLNGKINTLSKFDSNNRLSDALDIFITTN